MKKETVTNILLALVGSFGTALGCIIWYNQTKMQDDLALIKVAIGVIQNEQNHLQKSDEDFKEKLKQWDISSIEKMPFKHEEIYSIKMKNK